MIRGSLLPGVLLAVSLTGQMKEPVFYSWHEFEYVACEKANRDLTVQLHFRTRDRFSTFNLVRGSVFGSRRLFAGWIGTAGYFYQHRESFGDDEWKRQQRVFSSLSRPWRQARLRHIPRVQYDRLFGMGTPAYGRYRFSWQTEWTGRIRPYAGIEGFVEHAGVQRFRPRAGVRFNPHALVETDVVYIYDQIYLRSTTNRHILQTTFTFHRRRKD